MPKTETIIISALFLAGILPLMLLENGMYISLAILGMIGLALFNFIPTLLFLVMGLIIQNKTRYQIWPIYKYLFLGTILGLGIETLIGELPPWGVRPSEFGLFLLVCIPAIIGGFHGIYSQLHEKNKMTILV